MQDVIPSKEFTEMAETFEDEEHRRFGAAGFTGTSARWPSKRRSASTT
jgi:hypothetical protein